jgi:hypothetical protein
VIMSMDCVLFFLARCSCYMMNGPCRMQTRANLTGPGCSTESLYSLLPWILGPPFHMHTFFFLFVCFFSFFTLYQLAASLVPRLINGLYSLCGTILKSSATGRISNSQRPGNEIPFFLTTLPHV